MSVPNPAAVDWVPLWPTGIAVPPGQPSVRVYRGSVLAVANNTWTPVPFTAARYDVGGPHWAAGTPTRLTCVVAGTYHVWASTQFVPGAGGYTRQNAIMLNGSTYSGVGGNNGALFAAAGYPISQASELIQMVPGDYVECSVFQDSGGSLNTNTSDTGTSRHAMEFGMVLVGGMQGPPGAGIPTPTVAGQWVKGAAGNAAIWSPIAHSDLPTELIGGYLPPGNDWNQAQQSGWYSSSNAANAPAPFGGVPGSWLLVRVENHSPGAWTTQTAWAFTEGASPPGNISQFRRRCNNGTWQAWQHTDTGNWLSVNGNLGYAGGFTDYGAPWGPAKFRKVSGMVILEGLISNPATAGTIVMFALPAGYRPLSGRYLIFRTACSYPTATQGETIRIYDNGNVEAQATPGGGWLSLTGCTFMAEG